MATPWSALKWVDRTRPTEAGEFPARPPARKDDERELPEFRPLGDHLPAGPRPGDPVPESGSEGADQRNHVQPVAERRRRGQCSRRHHRRTRDLGPHEGRALVPDLCAERSQSCPDALQEGRDDYGQAAVGRQQLAAHNRFQHSAGSPVPRPLGLHDPPDAGRRRQGDGLRQVEGEASDRSPGARHVRGRRRRRRGQGRPAGDRRIPARPAEVPEARRADSARRAARRPARHRQDADGARGCGRSQRAVLHHFGLGLRRNVRRRRRQPCARHVRASEEECALHYLHR